MKQKEIFLSLKKRDEIAELFTKGETLYSRNFMIRTISKREKKPFPVGILWTVPRKMKRAVDRNRLRRVMKASLYQAFCELGSCFSKNRGRLHMAILPKKDFEKLSHSERVAEMKTVLQRLGYESGQ